MRIIICVMFFLMISCRNGNLLKKFHISKSEHINFDLGFYDTIQINTIKDFPYEEVQVTFNASSKMLGKQWVGEYYLYNDTLELSVYSDTSKDKYPFMDFSDAHTITYHYYFKGLDVSKYHIFFSYLDADSDNIVD